MPGSATPRLRTALLPLALLISACGRFTDPGSEGTGARVEPSPSSAVNFTPNGGRTGEPEMLASPIFMPWGGGDPTWSLSRQDSDRLVYAYTQGFSENDDPADDGFPRMPEECYSMQGGEGPMYPREDCLFPVLRQLVSDDALRYFRETGGSMVLGLAGERPVQVADIWWGPFGPNDHPEALVLTPEGFMSSSPNEWAPYALAEEEASRQEVLPQIIAATGEGGPYYFNHVYPWQIHAPARTSSGWEVATTAHVIGGCHACDVEFGGRFTLEFDLEGTPTGARFDGFCWFDYFATDNPNADREAILAIRDELPQCEPSAPAKTSVIDWQNPSWWWD